MNMLLSLALQLLLAAQQPNVPISLQNEAISVAQIAISEAGKNPNQSLQETVGATVANTIAATTSPMKIVVVQTPQTVVTPKPLQESIQSVVQVTPIPVINTPAPTNIVVIPCSARGYCENVPQMGYRTIILQPGCTIGFTTSACGEEDFE